MSLNQSLNITIGSLQNNQYGLTVVSHNIANLNTEGYTRKKVNFKEQTAGNYGRDAYSQIKNMAGASLAGITDYIDEAALGGISDANASAQYYNTLTDAIKGLEDLSDSLGENGLNAILNDFYTAASNLEQFPDDLTIRQQYVNAAQNVCDKFNDISKNYTKYQSTMISSVEDDTEIVNDLLNKIASSNENYIKNSKETVELNNTYALIQELSSYVDVTTEKSGVGTIDVYIGDVKVVQAAQVNYKLKLASDTSRNSDVITFSLQSTDEDGEVLNGTNNLIKGGKLGAYIEFLNGTNKQYYNITDMQSALNSAAKAFADEMNNIQTYREKDADDNDIVFAASLTSINGETQLEKATYDMFVASNDNPIDASNISVNSDIQNNVFLVAAARIDTRNYPAGSDDWKLAVGNSSNVSEILNLQDKKICSYGGVANNVTLSDYLTSIAAKNGLDATSMSNKANSYQDILDTAISNYSNASGVNLDEEIADMLKYQRAYEASARVFSMINSLYDYILGMV